MRYHYLSNDCSVADDQASVAVCILVVAKMFHQL